MIYAVLGTGAVGRTIAGGLAELGHNVPSSAPVTRRPPAPGGEYAEWAAAHEGVELATFADAAAGAELIVNATNGAASLEVLGLAGADNLAGKVLVDISNPLDFSQGLPPTLFVKDTDSLGEQIQRAFPDARVVKTLNTVNADLMVDPGARRRPTHVRLRQRRRRQGRWSSACSRASAGTTSSTSATSPPPAAPRCTAALAAPVGRARHGRRSTSRSCADEHVVGVGLRLLLGSLTSWASPRSSSRHHDRDAQPPAMMSTT